MIYDYNSLKNVVKDISIAASAMCGKNLRMFAIALIRIIYTRVSDLTETESTIRDAIETEES